MQRGHVADMTPVQSHPMCVRSSISRDHSSHRQTYWSWLGICASRRSMAAVYTITNYRR